MAEAATHESRLEFKFDELLGSPKILEPLIAGGVRCHGGFDADGNYVSPRTLWRNPAIRGWQEQHLKTSSLPVLEIPKDAIPPHLPNVEQAKLLLKEGVREPMVRTLTEIAIVEGFGATIRELPVPPLQSFIREDVTGTALAHLTGGLFEAHARDEAGWGEEGGHKQMWEAARDLALSNPKVPGDVLMAIMGRRGNGTRPARVLPGLSEEAERLVSFMMNVLIIEVFAESTFRWAEAVLADPEVSDAPREASDMIRYIRSDESPHVEYLRTALSEISARTLIGEDGKKIAGQEAVTAMLDRSLGFIIRQRREERLAQLHASIRASATGIVKDVEDLIARFDALATPWSAPARFLAAAAAAPQAEARH
ncbi:MAG: hypothetical protein JOZ55_11280 [Alphaproteobacteria bacterium]|nr:hypothetical protein [Alphaproteobacteria bacterium]